MVEIEHRSRKFRLDGVSKSDHIADRLAHLRTFYEIDLLTYIESIKDFLPPGAVVDVGANIGNHTIFLSEFVRTPVVGFEPNPQVLPVLKSNLAANNVQVRIVELGLGASASRGTMEVLDQANIGNARINSGGGDIEISTLDEECGDMQIGLIKVDVEGMELEVLRGAVKTLTRCQPHLFLEAATDENYRELAAFLAPLGYRPVAQWANTPVWHFAVEPSAELMRRAKWRRRTRGFRSLGVELRALAKR